MSNRSREVIAAVVLPYSFLDPFVFSEESGEINAEEDEEDDEEDGSGGCPVTSGGNTNACRMTTRKTATKWVNMLPLLLLQTDLERDEDRLEVVALMMMMMMGSEIERENNLSSTTDSRRLFYFMFNEWLSVSFSVSLCLCLSP